MVKNENAAADNFESK